MFGNGVSHRFVADHLQLDGAVGLPGAFTHAFTAGAMDFGHGPTLRAALANVVHQAFLEHRFGHDDEQRLGMFGHATNLCAAAMYSGMPITMLNGNVMPSAAVMDSAAFASGTAMRIAVGAAM